MKIRSLLIVSASAVVLLVFMLINFSGCNKLEELSRSGSKLIIDIITGTDSRGEPESTTIFSDVITNGSVFDDVATATLSAVVLDPDIPVGTFYQDIMVDQVDIEYSRADGLNVQGRDVPYSFSQKVTARVQPGGLRVELSFVLVQHTAKSESPLVELVNLGQEHILKLEAKVTFHGKDVGGHRVEPAVGYVSVWCANFADET
ncbi:MAG: hypothetical protein GTO45_28460 [Candidatus Aminicenantes bacterium]|nr:hypothetical protein [Candidatus Aminicenantes bacterium]NIM82730.1 hypothetical protein [Candidatus Aminicenantes bacterium]NIN22107.1 hypothetical protein [Candidatus Aminicenantes bacterium]NIN45866.1 hypothetical protein [Candidatus Aminicenantes bacterium]NIN88703.1 hypothetical protein [Candidatus Aminicenantes bacterium]